MVRGCPSWRYANRCFIYGLQRWQLQGDSSQLVDILDWELHSCSQLWQVKAWNRLSSRVQGRGRHRRYQLEVLCLRVPYEAILLEVEVRWRRVSWCKFISTSRENSSSIDINSRDISDFLHNREVVKIVNTMLSHRMARPRGSILTHRKLHGVILSQTIGLKAIWMHRKPSKSMDTPATQSWTAGETRCTRAESWHKTSLFFLVS